MNELSFETCDDVCNPNGNIHAYWQCPTVCQPDCGGCYTEFVPDPTEDECVDNPNWVDNGGNQLCWVWDLRMNELGVETCEEVCSPNGNIKAYYQCPTVCQPDCGGCYIVDTF